MIDPIQWCARPVIIFTVKANHSPLPSLLILCRRLTRLVKMIRSLGVFESNAIPRIPLFYVVPFLTPPPNLPRSHEQMSNRAEWILIMMDSLTCGIYEFWFLKQAIDFQYTTRRKLLRLRVEIRKLYPKFVNSVTCGTTLV